MAAAQTLTPPTRKPRIFYGWFLVGVGFITYGFGLAPSYYSWGFYGPELQSDLGLSKTQIGSLFGLYALVYSIGAPLAALSIARWGLRRTIPFGALMAAAGFYGLSRADSLLACYISFSLIGGLGIGLSAQLPSQTLASNWFRKYRARVMGVILASGGIVGIIVPQVNNFMLDRGGWRAGWVLIAAVSVAVAAVAAVFVRNSPEELGLEPDGIEPTEARSQHSAVETEKSATADAIESKQATWTAAEAVRTPQFFIVTAGAVACSAPWGAFIAHGRLHLASIGFSAAMVADFSSARSLVSIFGRLAGGIGDFISPARVFAIALTVEALGIGAMAFARTPPLAYACHAILGLGFGVAILSVPVVIANFFGREAFAGAQGMSRFWVGIVRYLGPTLTGWVADTTGSYRPAFLGLMVIGLIGAACVAWVRHPGEPPRKSRSPNERKYDARA